MVVDPVGVGQERQQPAGQDDAVPVAQFLLVGDGQGVLQLQVFGAVAGAAAAGGDDGGLPGPVGGFPGDFAVVAADDGDAGLFADDRRAAFAVQLLLVGGGLGGVDVADPVFALRGRDVRQDRDPDPVFQLVQHPHERLRVPAGRQTLGGPFGGHEHFLREQ